MSVVIYHNPNCGTSRNVLGLIRNSGVEPTIIHYLENPPSLNELLTLLKNSGLTPREALRANVEEFARLNLDDLSLSDDVIISAMLEHPILINRPFVITNKGTRLCRPSELVLEILESPQLKSFYKEDGERII